MNLNETTNGLNNNTANTQDTADSKDTQTTLNKTYSVGEVNGLLTAFWQFINSCNMTNNRTALNDTVVPSLQAIVEAIKATSGKKIDNKLDFLYIRGGDDTGLEEQDLVTKQSSDYANAIRKLANVCPKDITNILEELKYAGVYLSGPAGIGKGYIAGSIGARLLDEGYDGYKNFITYFSETTNPAYVTYGSLVKGSECIGLIPQAFKYANEHKNIAVVIILDEINRSDYMAILANVFELISHKQMRDNDLDTSYMTLLDGTKIEYTKNIYIIATGNTGDNYKTADATANDTGFADRFTKVELTGVFSSLARVDEYFKYIKDNHMSKLSDSNLNDVCDLLKSDIDDYNSNNPKNKWNGIVSYRDLGRLMDKVEDEDTLYNEIKKLCGLDFKNKDSE